MWPCFRQACPLLIEHTLCCCISQVLEMKNQRISTRCSRGSMLTVSSHATIPITSVIIIVTVILRYREEDPLMSKHVHEVALLVIWPACGSCCSSAQA